MPVIELAYSVIVKAYISEKVPKEERVDQADKKVREVLIDAVLEHGGLDINLELEGDL